VTVTAARPVRADENALLKRASEGAVGCYIFDRDRGDYTAGVIDVLTLDGDRIAAVTGFVTFGVADLPEGKQVTAAEVFARFGLPARLP
jgi:hypothetical protein